MNVEKLKAAVSKLWIPLAMGASIFLLIPGAKILNPTYVDWILRQGDPLTSWLGWQFYRQAPLWQWPLGANPDYGFGLAISLINSDSLPLLALAIKPFSSVLPDHFQYLGIWLLACFLLQALFAWLLLGLTIKDPWLRITATGFFLIAPVFLWRLHGHYSLCGQWLVLAALYCFFHSSFSFSKWAVLLVTSSLVHPYLLSMVATIFFADILTRLWQGELTRWQALVCAIAGMSMVAATLWMAGGFMAGGGNDTAGGFGFYRMNILSLIDSDNVWSRIMPDQAEGPGDYEGFNYLGIGILLLTLIAIPIVASNYEYYFRSKKTIAAIILAVALTSYAISDHMGFGGIEVFSYKLPSVAYELTGRFRASGRIFWPVYYMIVFSVLSIVLNYLDKRASLLVAVSLLFVQFIDERQAFGVLRAGLANGVSPSVSILTSTTWNRLAGHYDKVLRVPPQNAVPDWGPAATYAAMHKLRTNYVYVGRLNPRVLLEAQESIMTAVESNDFDPSSLYFFADDALWNLAVRQLKPTDVAGELDGFRVLAPNLKNLAPDLASNFRPPTLPPRWRPGAMAGPSDFHPLLGEGWSTPEPWGVWSDGKSARLSLPVFAGDFRSGVRAEFRAYGFVPWGPQLVVLTVRGAPPRTFLLNGPPETITIDVPAPALSAIAPLQIDFRIPDAISPLTAGVSQDTRQIGIGLLGVSVTSLADAP